MTGKKMPTSVRVPRGWYYWTHTAAYTGEHYDTAVYKSLEKGDFFDQQRWEEGRYYLSEEDARAGYARYKRKKMNELVKLSRLAGCPKATRKRREKRPEQSL